MDSSSLSKNSALTGIFTVSKEKQEKLFARMKALGVQEKDIEESFIRSSGPGGQNVNKVSTCVVICHRPTGISVKCQKSRSQALNRFYARRILLDKIEEKKTGIVAAQKARIAKIRKQKQKRSKRAKEKMLLQKRIRSEKKKNRQNILSAGLND